MDYLSFYCWVVGIPYIFWWKSINKYMICRYFLPFWRLIAFSFSWIFNEIQFICVFFFFCYLYVSVAKTFLNSRNWESLSPGHPYERSSFYLRYLHTLENYPRCRKGLFVVIVIIILDQIDYERIKKLGGP